VIRKHVGDPTPGLVQRATTAEFVFRMLRRIADPELPHLPVADSGDAPALDQRLAVGGDGVDQPERTVADAADDGPGSVGFGDLGSKRLGEVQVESGAPTASQIDDVVRPDVNR
jgi:hypothetical protein